MNQSDVTARCSCTFLTACVLENNIIFLPAAEDEIVRQAGHAVMICLLSSCLGALTSRDLCRKELLTQDCKTNLCTLDRGHAEQNRTADGLQGCVTQKQLSCIITFQAFFTRHICRLMSSEDHLSIRLSASLRPSISE